MRAHGVTLLRADWTRRDPAITVALEQLGRSGVPVYVLHSAGKPPVVFSGNPGCAGFARRAGDVAQLKGYTVHTPDPGPATTIAAILEHYRTVAVVGLSPKSHRDSHEVARYMQAQGWRIVPINPNAAEILGETAYPSLTEAARHHRIELVNVFRNSAEVPPLVAEAISIGVQALWMQLGVVHELAAQEARAAGLLVVQDRCLYGGTSPQNASSVKPAWPDELRQWGHERTAPIQRTQRRPRLHFRQPPKP